MGILSKLASTASSTITIGTVMAKTASHAAFAAMDTSLESTKLATDFAFSRVEDFVKVAEEVLEQGGGIGDRVTNFAFVMLMMVAKMMPKQLFQTIKMLQLLDDEVVDTIEGVVESIVTIIETGDLQGLEETIGDLLEVGLFSVTALQPNLLLALFMVMSAVLTGAATLVSRGVLTQEEAELQTRNICAKILRTYGEVGYKRLLDKIDNTLISQRIYFI